MTSPTKGIGGHKKIGSKGATRRRYPFRATGGELPYRMNRKISFILRKVDDMLYDLVRQRQKEVNLSGPDVEDIVQECRIHLWQKSLPHYDAHRQPHTTISTFIYRCAYNFINQELRSRCRHKSSKKRLVLLKHDVVISQTSDRSNTENNNISDRQIEELARKIRKNPEKYLTPRQVEVFKKVMDSPSGTLMKDLAASLEFERSSSLSMMLQRIKEKISNMDLNDVD